MDTTKIIIDRLGAALEKHGFKPKRAQLLEAAAMAFGYYNSNEFNAASKRGDLVPPAAIPLGRVSHNGDMLIVLRDPTSGAPYAIDESFLEGPVEDERRERFGPTPYGSLIDLSDLGDHPVTTWASGAMKRDDGARTGDRYTAHDGSNGEIASGDDFDIVKGAYRKHDERGDLAVYVIDHQARMLMRARTGRRGEPLADVGDTGSVANRMAAQLIIMQHRIDDLENSRQSLINLAPDWRSWEADLKKASHKRQTAIDDETLYRFRHAVADNHCKSSSSERSEVEYREQKYMSRYLGGLLARLDAAEETLADAGLTAKPGRGLDVSQAQAMLAAIDAVKSRDAGTPIPGLFEVEATRDGDKCHEFFRVDDDRDPDDRGREIAAEAFRLDIADFEDEDGMTDDFDSECDSFEVSQVRAGEVEGILTDIIVGLANIRHDHPLRIKAIAAREKLTPKATV